MNRSRRLGEFNLRDFVFSYGFLIVLVLVVILFSAMAPGFFNLNTVWLVLHTAAPTMVLASGLAFVIMTANIDISVGSVAFLASAIGAMLISRYGVSPLLAIPVILLIGVLLGALNGFIVTVLKVNPLITSLGSLIALRGLGLQLTQSFVISLPGELRTLGNSRIGPIYVDILIALAILVLIDQLHRRTPFGRHVMAIGNGAEVAERLGVQVKKILFLTFVFSGLMASLGSVFLLFQIGAVTPTTGNGYEFTAIALLVIGGVSLFGGEGSIIPGIILGAVTLTVIEAGLNFMGASVYVYPFVRGGIIFIAMFADALKAQVKPRVKTMEETEPTGLAPEQA